MKEKVVTATHTWIQETKKVVIQGYHPGLSSRVVIWCQEFQA